MPTYGFIETNDSFKRGYNKSIRVYRIINNKPKFIGDGDYQSKAWRGARGEASLIIAKKEGYKMKGYGFQRKDIEVIEL